MYCIRKIIRKQNSITISCIAKYESVSAKNEEELISEMKAILKANDFVLDTETVSDSEFEDIVLYPGINILSVLSNNRFLHIHNYEVQNGVRMCYRKYEECKIPFGISLPKDIYMNYVMKNKSDIMRYLDVSYLCFKHRHTDKYIHFAPINVLKQIIATGKMSSRTSSEDNTIGKGIYTYPLKSGMYFCNGDVNNYGFIIFETDALHHHIVQTDDTPYAIGEADFLLDEIDVKVEPIIYTEKEIEEISREEFDWSYARDNYYGIPNYINHCDYDDLPKVIEMYN